MYAIRSYYAPQEIEPLLAHARVKAIVTGPGSAGALLALAAKSESLQHVVVLGNAPEA